MIDGGARRRRRALALAIREQLQELRVGDAQVDERQAAVVAVEPHHLGEAHRVAVELQRTFEIGDFQRHMANAGQSKLRHFVLRRDDYKPDQL